MYASSQYSVRACELYLKAFSHLVNLTQNEWMKRKKSERICAVLLLRSYIFCHEVCKQKDEDRIIKIQTTQAKSDTHLIWILQILKSLVQFNECLVSLWMRAFVWMHHKWQFPVPEVMNIMGMIIIQITITSQQLKSPANMMSKSISINRLIRITRKRKQTESMNCIDIDQLPIYWAC